MGNVSKTSPVNGLQWVEHLSPLKEDFIRNYDDNNDVGHFLEIDIEYPKKKKNLIFIKIYCFYQKERKLKNVTNLFVIYKTKKTMLFT